jgi:hypothetical protein
MNNTRMLAYHGDPAVKEFYLARVREHQADQILQNYGYWHHNRGCAVGCTVHGDDHKAYEVELGIPVILARLEDLLFEGMSPMKSKAWPEQFLTAIPVGADLSQIWSKFANWLLVDTEHGFIAAADSDALLSAITGVANFFASCSSDPAESPDALWAIYDVAVLVGADAAPLLADLAECDIDAISICDNDPDRVDAYDHLAEKLLELLGAAPVKDRASKGIHSS